jgi:LuxR family maltose regulon positive regulatory protein
MRPAGSSRPPSPLAAGHDPAAAVPGATVSRRRLTTRLTKATRVTVVSAPAGSGKTLLLRSWMAESGLAASTAWVPALGGEPDPQRFWISVLDALRGTAAGSNLIRELTAAPDLDGWAIVERLLADLSALGAPLWLVIDDLQEVRSGETLRQLELLILRAPPQLQFVFATRHDLRLGLHRLRLEGELTEIRAVDLRFTLDETRAMLTAAGVTLTDSALALLHARTEGWAAGLRLASLSLTGHPDPEQFAAEFSGTERTVAEYLLAEVLERQSEEVRRLLLRTSMLDRVSGPLADLLAESSGGERILQDLEEASAFVVSLDGRRTWFRYHRLFADLLQLELRRAEPGNLPALHRAAAGWYAEHGYPVSAIRQAQAAQAWDQAAHLLSDHYQGLVLDGQGGTVRELLARFPAEVRDADPELSLLMAADELFGTSLNAAERRRTSLNAAEDHLARAAENMDAAPADRREHFEVYLAITRLSLAQRRGDIPAVTAGADRLLALAENGWPRGRQPPGQSRQGLQAVGQELRALALLTLGAAELWALRAGEAERHLEQGITLARQIGRPWLEITGLAYSAWAGSFRSFALTVQRSAQAIALAEEHGWTSEPVVAVAYAAFGAVRVWQMRLDEAEALLARAERALQAEAEPAAGLVFHQAVGMLELARGHDADALNAFKSAEKLAGLLVEAHPRSAPMRAQMMQVLVRLGETERAEESLAKLEETGRGEVRNALAALRLAQRDPRGAVAAVAPVLVGSAPVTNGGWVTQAFLLEAIARDALGDANAAQRALNRALDLAQQDDILFAFVLHPVPRLLARHARQSSAHAAMVSRIRGLLAGSGAGVPSAGGSRAPGESLRARGVNGQPLEAAPPLLAAPSTGETRVLRYLPTNLAAPEIASELSLSVNTVRTHMRHLYEKLGVHTRTEAVARARALGLLAPPSRGS